MHEMIKNSREITTPFLQKIVNCILSQSIYPKCWTISFLNPIFKSKSPLDPNNYRGIAMMSCLAKLFNKILRNRLEKFFETNNIINKEQIGFMKKSRTSDHMFILRTLIDKMKMKMIGKSKLFCCFVDFRKAFDTVV